MHRVRQSLPYYSDFGWEAEVITVALEHIEVYSLDPLLLETIPASIKVHQVKALPVKYTRKFGLGSLSMRAYPYILKKGDQLLRTGKFDLVFFSTTAFHVMALGPRWKRKFGVPFILDIQDPWRNDFYLNKPKAERPPKFFISYNIDKYLEAATVPKSDGIISVSQGYCDTFMQRYPQLKPAHFRVIPFGASSVDFDVMRKHITNVEAVQFDKNKYNIVYIGRGGHDMKFSLSILFKALRKGMEDDPGIFSKLQFWFIGTSYAPPGKGKQTIRPLADLEGVGELVTEIPDRLPYFETLFLLTKADMLFVPGSVDTSYTASKIYSYFLAEKKLVAVFYEGSSVVDFLREMKAENLLTYNHLQHEPEFYVKDCLLMLKNVITSPQQANSVDFSKFLPYTAKVKTGLQVDFFNEVIARQGKVEKN